MANARRGNLGYVDTVGIIADSANTQVCQILLRATAAGAIVIIGDAKDATPLLNLALATDAESASFEFPRPLVFPSGVQVLTLTNAIMTLVYTATGASK